MYFYRVVWPTFADGPGDEAAVAQGLADFCEHAAVPEAHLHGREWLLPSGLSYADFRLASALPFAEAAGLPLDPFPQIRRWHDQLLAIEAWRTPFAGL